MPQILAAFILQLLHQALLAVLVAVAVKYLCRLIKKAKESRPNRFKIDLGAVPVAVVITIGGTRQERKALNETKGNGRDG